MIVAQGLRGSCEGRSELCSAAPPRADSGVQVIIRRLDDSEERPFEWKPVPILIGVVLVAAAIAAFFRYRHALMHLEVVVQSFGFAGVVFAVIVMALLCILPVPSEFFILINMEIYGVFWGLLYSWIGGVLGAVAALYLTRWIGQGLVRRMFSERRQRQIDEWIKRRGTMGLLALRFVPFVPYHALNYGAGLLTVNLWPFVWTTALGIIPFDLWMGGVFLGISHGVIPALIGGLGVLAVIAVLSYVFRKKWLAAFSMDTLADKPEYTKDDRCS
jgi:uncharacterized membrane protein YdjX (TVP38/TMEM64 family)